jgi:tetratricopeptide (TPR) repeat protein
MGERFMFMPSVGVCLIAAVLLHKLTNKKIANWSDLKLALPIIALFLVGFSLKTVVRNMAWKNNYTLFSTDIQTSINSAKLNNSMAGITSEEAIKPENAAKKQQMLNDAIRYGLKARELHPTYANPNVIIGNAYLYLGDYQKSIEFYDYTLRITGEGLSDYTNALNNKKVALANIKPEYLTKQGEALANQQFAEAIRIGEQAIAAGNISVELFGQQGAAYGANGQHQKALEMFQKVLQLDPNSAQGYLNMGYAYQGLGDTANTNASFEKAYSLDSNLRPK